MMIWKLKYSSQKKSELSSTIARVKHLMQQFQALTHSPHSSSPSQVSDSNRSSSPASSETTTLLTPPQSLVTHHDMPEHSDSNGTHGKPQKLISDVSSFLTEPHMPQHRVNSTVHLPRLDLPTFSGNALEC